MNAPVGRPESWRLEWLHRGNGDDLWVRIYTEGSLRHSAPPELVLRHCDSRARRVVALQRRSRDDATVFDGRIGLAETFASAADPTGTWRLLVRQAGADTLKAEEACEFPLHGASDRLDGPAVRVETVAGPVETRPDGSPPNVSLQVQALTPWAEVAGVESTQGTLRVHGRIVGDVPAADSRRARAAECVLRRREDGHSMRQPARLADGEFSLAIDEEWFAPPRATETWDLWLRPGGESAAIRLGRHLDDIADKKRVIHYPWTSAGTSEHARARPYYTAANNLSLVTRGAVGPEQRKKRRTSARPQPAPRAPLAEGTKKWAGRVLKAVEWAAQRRRSPRVDRASDQPPRVHILIHSIFGMGGTIRTVVNLANYLAAHGWDVHLTSIFRTARSPFFRIDERVRLRVLCDERKLEREAAQPPTGVGRRIRRNLHRRSSWLVHEEEARFQRNSLWTDIRILRAVWSVRSGILVTTRAGLNIISARFAHPAVAKVGQEHLTHDTYQEGIRAEMAEHYGKLDALGVLSRADQHAFAELLRNSATRVTRIHNALPGPPAPRSELTARRIVAAGRLTPMKGFDLLIRAFAEVRARHPDWQLCIYGSGGSEQRLRNLVQRHDLHENVLLMGKTDRMEQEMAKGSIYALSSRFEPFGMVLTEALSAGLPIVSFDCPHGPGEILTPGVDGLLVPPEDVSALADGICRLIEDDALRHRFARAAVETAGEFSMETIGSQWTRLFRTVSELEGSGSNFSETGQSPSERTSGRTITQSNSSTRPVRFSRLTGNIPVISKPADSYVSTACGIRGIPS